MLLFHPTGQRARARKLQHSNPSYIPILHLVEDDEDELHDLLPGGRVGDGLLDLREADVAVAARGAEKLTLETAAVVGADHARHVRELHVALAARLT